MFKVKKKKKELKPKMRDYVMKQFVRESRVCGGRNSSSTTMSPELLTNRGKVPSFLKEQKKNRSRNKKIKN